MNLRELMARLVLRFSIEPNEAADIYVSIKSLIEYEREQCAATADFMAAQEPVYSKEETTGRRIAARIRERRE